MELGLLFSVSQPPPAQVLPTEKNWGASEGSRTGQTHSDLLASHAPGLSSTGMESWPSVCLLSQLTSADPACYYPLLMLERPGAKVVGSLEWGGSWQGDPMPATLNPPGTSCRAGFDKQQAILGGCWGGIFGLGALGWVWVYKASWAPSPPQLPFSSVFGSSFHDLWSR